jgi:hypothetical protein
MNLQAALPPLHSTILSLYAARPCQCVFQNKHIGLNSHMLISILCPYIRFLAYASKHIDPPKTFSLSIYFWGLSSKHAYKHIYAYLPSPGQDEPDFSGAADFVGHFRTGIYHWSRGNPDDLLVPAQAQHAFRMEQQAQDEYPSVAFFRLCHRMKCSENTISE